jgi:hypothetical protein
MVRFAEHYSRHDDVCYSFLGMVQVQLLRHYVFLNKQNVLVATSSTVHPIIQFLHFFFRMWKNEALDDDTTIITKFCVPLLLLETIDPLLLLITMHGLCLQCIYVQKLPFKKFEKKRDKRRGRESAS